MNFCLRPAVAADLEWLVELRAEVMRPDLERLGRYDPARVRERMRSVYSAELTRIIVVDGSDSGSITLRPDHDSVWLEHFYLAEQVQGKGIGHQVLTQVLAENALQRVRLNVLQGSPARRLYERHGFTVYEQDAVDVFMEH